MKINAFSLVLFAALWISRLATADIQTDPSPSYCNYVLTNILAAYRDSTDPSPEFKTEMAAAQALLSGQTALASAERPLAPLFERGLIYDELGLELRSRNLKTTEKIENTFLILAESPYYDALHLLIDNVMRRLLDKIGSLDDGTSDTFIKSYEERSKKLHIPFPEFVDLLGALRKQSKTQFHLLRLTLQTQIIYFPKELIAKIPAAPMFSFFNTPKPLPKLSEKPFWPTEKEHERIVSSKLDYVERLATTTSSLFDQEYLKRVISVADLYYRTLSKDDKIRFLSRAFKLAGNIRSDQIFLETIEMLRKIIYPAWLRTDSDNKGAYLEALYDLRQEYQNTNETRYASVNSLIIGIEKILQEITDHETVDGKITQLGTFTNRRGGPDYFTTLSGELNNIRLHYPHSVEDGDRIGSLVGLTAAVEDDDKFIEALGILVQMTTGRPDMWIKLEDALDSFEYRLRQTGKTVRANAIHQAYLSARPVRIPPVAEPQRQHYGCFVAGTLVDTPKGPTPIEQLQTGDEVYSFDHELNKVVISTVEEPLIHFENQIEALTLENGVVLGVTAQHSFYSPELSDYAPLQNLSEGTNLVTRDLAFIKIKSIAGAGRAPAVYNLEIKKFHNYYVNGILVHNGGIKM